jgi:MFS family permease
MERKPHATGWSVLWSTAVVSLVSGILYVWSVISKYLVNELHWTNKEASLPYTTVTIAFVLAMLFFGRVLDSKGPSICILFSGLLMGGGLILSGLSRNPWLMVLTFGIINGAGIGITNLAASPTSMKWFPPEKKGMIAGIVAGGVGFAPVIYSPAANFLIKKVGLSATFIIFGVFALAVVIPLSRIIKNPPTGYSPKDHSTSEASGQGLTSGSKSVSAVSIKSDLPADMSFRDMLKTTSFYRFWIMLAFASSAGLMIIANAANIARIQVTWEGGYLLVILLSIFNAAGRILGGTISDKIGRINMMRIIFFLQAANMLLFARYASIAVLAVGIMAAGLFYGAILSVFPATSADYYGLKNYGKNYSALFTGWGVGGVIGPMTAAAIMDATKSYNGAYLVACSLLIVALLITFTFRKTKVDNKTPGTIYPLDH